MYVSPKRITKLGRNRFASALFINDVDEDVVDIFEGYTRNPQLLIVLAILILSKLLSVNYLGIVTTLPIYYFLYFFSSQHVRLSVTKHRMLITTSYKNPRIVKGFGITLFISSIIIGLRLAFSNYLDPSAVRRNIIRNLASSNILEFKLILFNYLQFFISHSYQLITVDSLGTIATNIYFGYLFTRIHFDFKEVNLSQVSEQLTTTGKKRDVIDMTLVVIGILLIFTLIPFPFSFIAFIVLISSYRFYQQPAIILSIFGQTSRPLVNNVYIDPEDYNSLIRVTSAIFKWQTPPNHQFENNNTGGLIPLNVTSIFDTGNQAWLRPALTSGNILGGIIAVIINTAVVVSLYRFAARYVPSAIPTVTNIMLILIGIMIVFGLVLYIITEVYVRLQTDEKLLIGSNFVARYINPSLWIVKGSKIEGTKVRRGIRNNIIRYDKARGVAIDFQRITFIATLLLFTLLVIWWSSLGAINLNILPQFFISSVNLIFEFLLQKAQAGFFIILSFFLWIAIFFFYPRFHSQVQPSLNLDLEYATVTPIVLKDFGDHMDASVQFAKAMINSSRPNRRYTSGRPGTILLDISLIGGSIGAGDTLIVSAGENQISKKIKLPVKDSTKIFQNLVVSGLKGYPSVELEIKLILQEETVFHDTITQSMIYNQKSNVTIDLASFGHLDLEIEISNKRA